jgi:acyl-CoA reductase-like NAD-dependent aldehyde dehydrogenase
MRVQIAPISVLEFAQIALDAGGRCHFHTQPRVCRLSPRRKVPSGVLSVLPGPGATTGKELVSHPLIRKVDITVSSRCANYLARL